MEKQKRRPFRGRSFVSVLTTISFLVLAFTGIFLYIVPPGRVANWTDWRLLGLSKHQWQGLHMCFAIVFLATSAFHIYLNWRALISYFKSRPQGTFAVRWEWVLAVLVSAIVGVGTLSDAPPFSSLLALQEEIKHSWEEPAQRAPIPHAELLSLDELAEYTDVDVETMLANLKSRGVAVDSGAAIVGELADAHGMTPQGLYLTALGESGRGRGKGGGKGRGKWGGGGCVEKEGKGSTAVKDMTVESGHGGGGTMGSGFGMGGQGRGFGRMTLQQYCASEGLDLSTAQERLTEAGLETDPHLTLRGIAEKANLHPREVRTILADVNP